MAVDTDLVRDRFDIVDIVRGYVDLKKAGKNYQGCCPFHDEKSPSFTVAQGKQFFHCFGCGEHGDVIDFVAKINRVEFIDAIKILDSSLLDDHQSVNNYVKTIRSRFYLDQSMPVGINKILSGCDHDSGAYFSGSKQILPLSSVSGETVCLAMVEGKGFDIRFLNKTLIWGSFFAMGNNTKPIVLVSDYWLALSVVNDDYCVMCVFDALNLFYVCSELNRVKASYKILCASHEDFMQAEKLHAYEVYHKTIGNSVITDQHLDNEVL